MSLARLKNPLRLLSSRRAAVWLLIVFVVYAAIASAIPQGAPDTEKVAAWTSAHPVLAPVVETLGLHAAFRHPVFIVLAAWLALATAACALERSRWALRQRALAGAVSDRALERLRTRQADAFVIPESTSLKEASDRVAGALRSLRLKVTCEGSVISGRSSTMGLLGSPLFHWSLAALFVVISVGQLTRAEGLIGIVAGASKVDAPASYGVLDVGPFHGDLTGLTLTVTRMERDLTVRGVSFGPTPYVEVRDGDRLLKGQYVRSNAPLRVRGLLIHMSGYDRAAVLSVTRDGTSESHEVFLDAEESAPGGARPVEISLGAQGAQKRVIVSAAETADPAIEITWDSANTPQAAVVLREGESVDIDGARVTSERLTTYARLSVVDDWSVWPIYVLFGLALLGIGAAVLTPARSAVVLIESGDGTLVVYMQARHARADPDWPTVVRRSVSAALEQGRETS